MKRLKVGILASGGGSNLQSIIDKSLDGSVNCDIVVVISNNSKAKALKRASGHGIDALHISAVTEGSEEKVDKRIVSEMGSRDVDIIVLAGHMKKIGPNLLDAYRGKIINIHPALLPEFGGTGMYGMHVHKAVIASEEKESGPTVHYVDNEYDHGRIIAQLKVPVYPEDTPEKLQKRVLAQEHKLLPGVIQKIAEEWES